MGKKNTGVASTPSGQTPTLNRLGSTGEKSQKTLHGFFTKTPNTALPATALPTRLSPRKKNGSLQSKMLASPSSSQITPGPSSDAIEPEEDIREASLSPPVAGLLSPSSSANVMKQTKQAAEEVTAYGTPSRKVWSMSEICWAPLILRRQSRRSLSTPNLIAKVQTTMHSSKRHLQRARRGLRREGKFPRAETKMCMSRTKRTPLTLRMRWTISLLPMTPTKRSNLRISGSVHPCLHQESLRRLGL